MAPQSTVIVISIFYLIFITNRYIDENDSFLFRQKISGYAKMRKMSKCGPRYPRPMLIHGGNFFLKFESFSMQKCQNVYFMFCTVERFCPHTQKKKSR